MCVSGNLTRGSNLPLKKAEYSFAFAGNLFISLVQFSGTFSICVPEAVREYIGLPVLTLWVSSPLATDTRVGYAEDLARRASLAFLSAAASSLRIHEGHRRDVCSEIGERYAQANA